jgi:hypothetical protein
MASFNSPKLGLGIMWRDETSVKIITRTLNCPESDTIAATIFAEEHQVRVHKPTCRYFNHGLILQLG